MSIKQPIKRIEALQPFSRDHHYGLLLCWKIREGLKRNIPPERIKNYIDWFWATYLKHHFEEEEKWLFPILGNENKLVLQALDEHKRIKLLFSMEIADVDTLLKIEQEVNEHIRFEERVLFNEIQRLATSAQLESIAALEIDSIEDDWYDEFWKN